MKKQTVFAMSVLAIALFGAAAQAGFPNVVLYFDGVPKPNPEATIPSQFGVACPHCLPTSTFVAVDPVLSLPLANIKVWADYSQTTASHNPPWLIGTSECFIEYIEYDFFLGSVYTISTGTCGAAILTIVPKPPATVVLGGGGAGNVVHATGLYSFLNTGTYVDRVFVGLDTNAGQTSCPVNGGICYYSGLYFTLFSPSSAW